MPRHAVPGMILAMLAWTTPAFAQNGPPLLLETAIQSALEANRDIAAVAEDITRVDADRAAVRSRRFPEFSVDFLGLYTFKSIDLFFPAGSFGVFPQIGPVPGMDTTVASTNAFSQLFSLRVTQPITQLREISLRTRQLDLGRSLAEESVRARRLAVVDDVQQTYYRLLQVDAALESSRNALTLYTEVSRVVAELRAQEVVLDADAMGVEVQIARENMTSSQLQRARATLQEQLNALMGRALETPFDVVPVPLGAAGEIDLDEARARALEQRSELRQLRLQRDINELDVKVAAEDRLPDVSATVMLSGLFNVDVLPAGISGAGVSFSWEPWDWGRRRAEIASKASVLARTNLQLRSAEDQVRLEVGDLYRKALDAREAVRVAELAEGYTRETLRVATERFAQQATLFRDVLEARTALSRSENERRQAVDAYLAARSEFRKAMGEQR